MRPLHLLVSAAALLTPAAIASSSTAAPAAGLPTPAPAVADGGGSVEPARWGWRWRCVKKGPCWARCRGDKCLRACYRSYRQCRGA